MTADIIRAIDHPTCQHIVYGHVLARPDGHFLFLLHNDGIFVKAKGVRAVLPRCCARGQVPLRATMVLVSRARAPARVWRFSPLLSSSLLSSIWRCRPVALPLRRRCAAVRNGCNGRCVAVAFVAASRFIGVPCVAARALPVTPAPFRARPGRLLSAVPGVPRGNREPSRALLARQFDHRTGRGVLRRGLRDHPPGAADARSWPCGRTSNPTSARGCARAPRRRRTARARLPCDVTARCRPPQNQRRSWPFRRSGEAHRFFSYTCFFLLVE